MIVAVATVQLLVVLRSVYRVAAANGIAPHYSNAAPRWFLYRNRYNGAAELCSARATEAHTPTHTQAKPGASRQGLAGRRGPLPIGRGVAAARDCCRHLTEAESNYYRTSAVALLMYARTWIYSALDKILGKLAISKKKLFASYKTHNVYQNNYTVFDFL